MAIPELDLKKVSLQAAVGYLISLHDNEVDWNLLGIKVIGVIDALPIPEGDYEYGNAYMIGTEPPYDMYIYTRPDGKVHTEGYWFPIGKFPMPGPQGPKGDGLDQIKEWTNGNVSNVTYDTTNGAKVIQKTTVNYTDSTDGSVKQQQFDTTTNLPIVPGKYISMNATSDNNKMEVKVDDTALSLDYLKLDKTMERVIPQNNNGTITWVKSTTKPERNTMVRRDTQGGCSFERLNVNNFATTTGEYNMPLAAAYYGGYSDGFQIVKTTTDTGTLSLNDKVKLTNYPNAGLKYDNKSYVRMDPSSYPNGTINYIHIDSVQDEDGVYKATGKCLSINMTNRAWKVVDLEFGGSNRTTHNLTLTHSSTGIVIYLSLTNERTETYEGGPAYLWESLQNNPIACTVNSGGTYSAGMITTEGYSFKVSYGNNEVALMTKAEVSITDHMV